MNDVKWPRGYESIYAEIKRNRSTILNGTMLSVDPASGGSSMPGFAIFRAGQLECSGEIKLPSSMKIHRRLGALYDKINTILPEPPDVFAIEQIRGQRFSHEFLRWAVGVSIAASRSPIMIETPLNIWRAVAKAMPDYNKSDQQDAILIGQSLIMLAQKYEAEDGAVDS